ncbi:hypothetical protein FY034_07280 [Trichlorobacter lovleyi]|uniref:hypothetical protein n=1 Tax=Trichlorobacter lovleyi TaxID=313985 RepID=UPI0022401802|nr:hypothetical protein [Trichlorobacter lovleyi]QOX78738.1 hypothetical protein FY034_07280 [Trichlorobacter lovleyi]
MKYKVLRGFCLGRGKDVFPSQEIELDPKLAELYLRQGRIAPIAVSGAVDMNKAALLASIAIAESVEVLNELVSAEETDTEIVAAYEARAAELEG